MLHAHTHTHTQRDGITELCCVSTLEDGDGEGVYVYFFWASCVEPVKIYRSGHARSKGMMRRKRGRMRWRRRREEVDVDEDEDDEEVDRVDDDGEYVRDGY